MSVRISSNTNPHALRAQLATMPADALFTTKEAACYCNIGGSTWERMRRERRTPPAIKLTMRTLGYRKHVLDAWLSGRGEKKNAA